MRPNIPKRLAAKIRSAQSHVIDARDSIINYEERINTNAARISEYESDPVAFAKNNYGKNSFDSYPVQTNISRCREDLEYRMARLPSKIEDLSTAEFLLEKIEEEILKEVEGKKSETASGVPWPKPLKSFERIRKIEVFLRARENLAYQRERAKEEEEFEAQEAEEERLVKIEEEEFYQQWHEDLEKMPEAERNAIKNSFNEISNALEAGTLTPMQIISSLISSQKIE